MSDKGELETYIAILDAALKDTKEECENMKTKIPVDKTVMLELRLLLLTEMAVTASWIKDSRSGHIKIMESINGVSQDIKDVNSGLGNIERNQQRLEITNEHMMRDMETLKEELEDIKATNKHFKRASKVLNAKFKKAISNAFNAGWNADHDDVSRFNASEYMELSSSSDEDDD